MVLDTSLLNTRQYKVRIKGKVEQFWERSIALPLHLGVVAIEKGAFWLPSTKVPNFLLTQIILYNISYSLATIVANFTYYITIHMCVNIFLYIYIKEDQVIWIMVSVCQ